MEFKLLTIVFLFFGILMLARFVGFILKGASENKMRDEKPINTNMTAPCPPHKWSDPPKKGLGIVYQCAKCGLCYPNSVETR